jgi:hypothetical protein
LVACDQGECSETLPSAQRRGTSSTTCQGRCGWRSAPHGVLRNRQSVCPPTPWRRRRRTTPRSCARFTSTSSLDRVRGRWRFRPAMPKSVLPMARRRWSDRRPPLHHRADVKISAHH